MQPFLPFLFVYLRLRLRHLQIKSPVVPKILPVGSRGVEREINIEMKFIIKYEELLLKKEVTQKKVYFNNSNLVFVNIFCFVVTYTTVFLYLFTFQLSWKQLEAAIENKWNADLYYEGLHITDGTVFYKKEVIEINELIERCQAGIESARKRVLAHTGEKFKWRNEGMIATSINMHLKALLYITSK